jgi:ubiquinone/menaquinone biosynthesis C-methylase UbiE
MALYSKREYWDERYSQTDTYEWFQNYNSLRCLLTVEALMVTAKANAMTPFPSHEKCRVLILGCGNSPLGSDMLDDGWKNITNIDFSSIVIEQMKKKHQDMNFICHDITKGIPFDDKSFDLIVCKGTFDAVLTSSGSVANAKFLIAECSRVLSNGHGVFFLLSYGNPDSRVVFLERNNDLSYYWQEVSVHTVARKASNKNKYVAFLIK